MSLKFKKFLQNKNYSGFWNEIELLLSNGFNVNKTVEA